MTGDTKSITVVMPMAGDGRRVQSSKSTAVFKPFLEVKNQKLYRHALASLADVSIARLIWVVRQDHLTAFPIEREAKNCGAELIVLPRATRGPLDTLVQAFELDGVFGPGVILDCDLRFESPAFDRFVQNQEWRDADGALIYFSSDRNRYSYLRDRDGRLLEIREKQVISNKAVCGCYFFSNLETVKDFGSEIVARVGGELFVSHLYAELLKHRLRFKTFAATNWISLGTSEEILAYR